MHVLDPVGHSRSQNAIADTPLAVAMKGALAGFAGTLALSVVVKGAQWLQSLTGEEPEQRTSDQGSETGIGAGQALAGGEVQAPFLDQSTEIFVQKVATGLFGTSLSGGARRTAGMAMHFLYGSFWGAVYGLVQSSLRLPPARHGLLYGLIVWLIGPATLVPAMHIMPPPQKQGVRQVLMVVGFHVAYGLGLGLTFDAFTQGERRG